jgi:hypothetical protein
MQRAAILASGSPVAFDTNVRARSARFTRRESDIFRPSNSELHSPQKPQHLRRMRHRDGRWRNSS